MSGLFVGFYQYLLTYNKISVHGFYELEHVQTCGSTTTIRIKIIPSQDFPGGPVVKTLSFQCRGPGFNPWSEK